jgi:AcrR family transcriptional regulator
MAGTKAAPKKRRTQAERRAATQGALLDATIDCLVEYGYANTTTNRIVERAGVSRGAQVHHYPTKADLVAEAVRHLAAKRTTEMLDLLKDTPAGPRRFEVVMDVMWAQHKGPLYVASIELFVAARTDPDLRKRMVEVEREVTRTIAKGMLDLAPEASARREFRDAVDLTLSAMRGLALLSFADPEMDIDRRWAAMRRLLIERVADASAA